jgi:hypothetical protein
MCRPGRIWSVCERIPGGGTGGWAGFAGVARRGGWVAAGLFVVSLGCWWVGDGREGVAVGREVAEDCV